MWMCASSPTITASWPPKPDTAFLGTTQMEAPVKPYYIAYDMGGTSLRVQLAAPDGTVMDEYETQGGSMNVIGYEACRDNFAAATQQGLQRNGLQPGGCLGLCAAACGVDSEPLREKYTGIFEYIGFAPGVITVYNDCEVMLYLDEDVPCIVPEAGTGAITMGRVPGGPTYRYGGWGNFLSDEGCAFWQARRAMEEMIRYLEGGPDCEILYNLFTVRGGPATPRGMADFMLANHANKPAVAAYALVVEQAAAQGDAVAAGILHEAGQRIAVGVDIIAHRLGLAPQSGFTVLLWGSVLLKSRPVADSLAGWVRQHYPAADIRIPELSALQTAMRIARRG